MNPAYVAKRLVGILATIALMSCLVFLTTHALPANTAALILGPYATPATQAALEHRLGLDQPMLTQYLAWAGGLLHGDFGQSAIMQRPVAPVLADALENSALLACASMLVVTLAGIALGVAGAVWRGRWPDHVVAIFAYSGLAVPEFYWGLILILVFCSRLHLLPSSGAGNMQEGFASVAAHLVLPVFTLAFAFLAHVSRMVRSSMLEVLMQNYIRAARARGLPETRVLLRHALPNALIPAVTVLAQDFGNMIGGVVAVETIFAYPGIGRLLVYALERLDLPMMQAAILVITAIFCLANLAADLITAALDPRIRMDSATA
jgi:peptide/nickel transport system permease protein